MSRALYCGDVGGVATDLRPWAINHFIVKLFASKRATEAMKESR